MKTVIRLLFLFALFIALIPLPLIMHAQEAPPCAFQAFEGGYMLWRGDTGEIWVLSSGDWQMRHFWQSDYDDLPDNPIVDTAPDGFVKPVSGFGRIWGNFPEVRQALGWALTAETGYTVHFVPAPPTAGGLQQTAVNFPDGREIVLREDQSWQFNDGQPRLIWSLHTPVQIPVALQKFERGYMMWWSETGSIWVLNSGTGQASHYGSLSYGALPDNPVSQLPPAGLVKPVMGFGKVWGHFPDVRQALGWATAPARSYTARLDCHPVDVHFSCEVALSDLGTISVAGSAWHGTLADDPVPTSTPASTSGITTYTSQALHYMFDYPADWFIRVEQHAGQGFSEMVALTSYDPAGGDPPHAAFANPSLVKITVEAYSYAGGWTFDAWVNQYKSQVDGATLQIAAEHPITLLGGIAALRLDMVSGTGGYSALITVIDGNGITVEGMMANTSIFDSVVSTLRPTLPGSAPAPTPVPTSIPDTMQTFSNPAYGCAIDYPAGWYIEPSTAEVVHMLHLTSYDPANAPPTLNDFANDPTLIEIELTSSPYLSGDLDTLIAETQSTWEAQSLQIGTGNVWTLPGNIPAWRVNVTSTHWHDSESFPAMIAVIDGQAIRITGRTSDFALFDSVVSTLRPDL